MLFLQNTCHTNLCFSNCPPQTKLNKSDQILSIKFRWVVLWGARAREPGQSCFGGNDACNNSTTVVTSVLDIVVYEDDMTVCEIEKCNAHTGEMVGYI